MGTIKELQFNVKLEDLKDLMQLKPEEAKIQLSKKFGGTTGLAVKLGTDLHRGISGENFDLDQRVRIYGKNEIPAKPPKSIFKLALEAIQDPTLIMLIVCAVISIGLSFYHPDGEIYDEEVKKKPSTDLGNLEWVEGVAIMIAVIVVVFVTAFNDWRKERQFRGLKDRISQDQMASVVRDGDIVQINLKELVVGDICCIKYGDLIPADGIVVQASDLKIDESSLTGETDLVKKNETDNLMILSGTHVMEGSGQFMVTAVGLSSNKGIIMALLGATDEEEEPKENKKNKKNAPKNKGISSIEAKAEAMKKKKSKEKKHLSVLQTKLGDLAMKIGYGGMLMALFTFILLCARMAIEEFLIKGNSWSNMYIKYIIAYLIQGITVIVVAVPEGLPLAVTLALAFAVRKMTDQNNLVRHLDACETMGNATTICSDKTGTLTTNRMTAMQCWISDVFHENIPDKSSINQKIRDLIYESISTNSGYTSLIEPSLQPGELPKQIGNKTECGLLGFVKDLGGSYEKIRSEYPSENLVKIYTFNSARKMMSTVLKNKNGPGYRVHSKGASEIVLAKCGYYLDAKGIPVKMTKTKYNSIILNVVEKMASNGLRTICVAYRDFLPENIKTTNEPNVKYYENEELLNWDDEPNVISDLTCLCLVGIEDPVRPEVPEAIKKCQTSGVVVRMVTGDNLKTATSIAMKCGIVKPSDNFLILESKEFNRRIRDKNGEVQQVLFDKIWPKLRVLARSSPQDKYILVNGIVESKISANREVVAVTGDGTNDGPALKRADVGFAMGIQGTDVAKEASDIILTDDNFSSIVKAMMWGRNVYDAIAKFLQFQLTANFSAGVFSVVCAASIQAVPLKAVQMLWVNLVMDTLASLALATEPPTEDLLKRAPYGRTKPMISSTMLKNIVFHAFYQITILFTLVWKIEYWMDVDSVIKYNDLNKLRDPSLHFTIIFNAFVIMTLFNELNGRKIHNERNVFAGIQNNFIFIGIWFTCLTGQILIVNFGGIIFSVEPLDLDQWMWCFLLGIGSLLWGQLVVSIPTNVFKKIISCDFFKKDQPVVIIETDYTEPDSVSKSKMLWIRGANRIQSQLKVVDAFKSSH